MPSKKKLILLPLGIILIILCVALVLLLGTTIVEQDSYAVPPTSVYTPGETLTPNCAPGDTNCTVTTPAISGANTDITSLSTVVTAGVTTLNGAVTLGDAAADILTSTGVWGGRHL